MINMDKGKGFCLARIWWSALQVRQGDKVSTSCIIGMPFPYNNQVFRIVVFKKGKIFKGPLIFFQYEGNDNLTLRGVRMLYVLPIRKECKSRLLALGTTGGWS